MNAARLLYRTRQFWQALRSPPFSEDSKLIHSVLTPAQVELFGKMQASEQVSQLASIARPDSPGRNTPGFTGRRSAPRCRKEPDEITDLGEGCHRAGEGAVSRLRKALGGREGRRMAPGVRRFCPASGMGGRAGSRQRGLTFGGFINPAASRGWAGKVERPGVSRRSTP
jgi:hypothetical protein